MTVDKSGNRVRRMFAQIATKYDRMNHLLSMNIDRYWRWRTVRTVRPQGTWPILDVCTGTGDLAFAMARSAPPGTPIVATDFCREMLDLGRCKGLRFKPTSPVLFLEADTQQLPFDDDQFQIVSVAFGLRNVADTEQGLREMRRVCRPGGRVAILEFTTPRRQPFKGLYGWYFRHVLPRLGHLLARNDHDAYDYLPASVGEFPQGEILAGLLARVGLREVRFYPMTFGIATLYVGQK